MIDVIALEAWQAEFAMMIEHSLLSSTCLLSVWHKVCGERRPGLPTERSSGGASLRQGLEQGQKQARQLAIKRAALEVYHLAFESQSCAPLKALPDLDARRSMTCNPTAAYRLLETCSSCWAVKAAAERHPLTGDRLVRYMV